MAWYAKAIIVGGLAGVGVYYLNQHLSERGIEGYKRAAIAGAGTLVIYIAVAKSVGDEDANLATGA